MIKEYKIHPAANLFPLMTESEISELANDIKANGLLIPITRKGDELWDGRNRLKACEKAGVKPRFAEPPRGANAESFIIAANIRRRHLTPDQRLSLIAAVLKSNPAKSDRAIAKIVKHDHKTVAKVRRKEEHVGTIPHIKHPKARKTPNAPKPPAPVPLAEASITASPEISEDRKADHAALDADGVSADSAEQRKIGASARCLAEFKTACDYWLPKLNADDLKKARAYFQDHAEVREKTNGVRATASAEQSMEERRALNAKLAEENQRERAPVR
jgi:ParB-like chromosome segregation protein Spo0J